MLHFCEELVITIAAICVGLPMFFFYPQAVFFSSPRPIYKNKLGRVIILCVFHLRHCMYTCHCMSLHVYLSCLLQCVKLVAIAIAFAVVLYVYSILHCFFVQYFPANLIPKIYQLLNPFLCHIPSCRAIVSLISRPVTFSVARKKVTAFV